MGRLQHRLTPAVDDGPVLCLCLTQARTPDIVLVAATAGFDAIYVDLQHGVMSLDVASMLCVTAMGVGMLPLVRVPSLDTATITRVLDGGALGVIVPSVETAEQAQAVVDACRFPPTGARTLYGLSPVTQYRAASHDELRAALDADVVVAPMIESAAAVEHVDEIAAVDGVDMLLVGAHDLSSDLEVPGQIGHPAVREALDAVAQACRAHGRCFGLAGVTDPDQLGQLRASGLGFVSAGSDVGLLAAAAAARANELRALLHLTKD